MAHRSLRRESTTRNEANDVRIEDYLNDKLQTHADLENLDALLHNVRQQQELLRQQLVDAEADLDRTTEASTVHKDEISQKAAEFNKRQKEIDRRLLIVTNSDTSDVAVAKFSKSMDKLNRLDVAKNYVELLAKVEQLSSDARSNFKVSPQAALKPYVELQGLTNVLKKAQPAAEYAAPHLVDHVENSTRTLWAQMKAAFSADFEKTLKKMKWPGKDVTMDRGLDREWSAGVLKLLELQGPELKAYEAEDTKIRATRHALVLLPLEVMAHSLELRFKYHFEGDRPTNRLEKPEYFLSHAVGLLNTYEGFFATYLQPVLQHHFGGTNLALNPLFIDSTSALTAAVLPMVRQKVTTILPQVAQQPQLLSHLMHELMSFDTSLRDDWGYDGGQGFEGWKGLTWEVLVEHDWFGRWLQVEKDFAVRRYEAIIEPEESREIDYDSVDPGITKPTKAAIRVNDLLETITDRYRPLNSLSQKMRFLIDIQIDIFDLFHARLHSSLEAYLTMTSTLARTVHGLSKEDQASLQGIGGLDRLCRVYGSADYLERKMRDWSDDVFFLELWDELQYRARTNSSTGRNVAKDMSIEDVAGRTSNSVTTGEDGGALFDETAAAYHRLRVRTEEIIIDTVSHNIHESLKPYGRINPWSSISSPGAISEPLAITAELDNTFQQLSSYLSFLSKVLADAPLRRISRQVAQAIQNFFWDTILMRHHFSASGIAQLRKDVSSIWEVFGRNINSGHGETSMKRLREALELLSTPADGVSSSSADEEEPALTIRNIEERVFRDNESARDVLEELGCEALNESDARNVLERRVELSA